MTVSTETPLHIYTANGVTTEWSYTFTTLQNSDVHLIVATDSGVENEISSSDFTLDSVNKTVTYPKTSSGLTPVANGYKVVVYRQVTANQTLDLDNSQPYTLTQLETSYDKLTAMLQDVKNDLTRVPHWKKSEVPTSTEVEDLITDISNVAANTALAIAAADRAEAAAIAGLPYLHAITDVGCACNGSTDDYSTLNTYFTTNTDDCALFIPSRTLIGTSWSVPTNIKAIIFDSANGQLSVPTTKTLTFTGQYIDCPLNKFIFYGAGTYAGTISNSISYLKWFGALGNDSNDDTTAIQNCVTFSDNVYITPGTYKITNYISITSGKSFNGFGNTSIIKQYTAGKPCLLLNGEKLHIKGLYLTYDQMQTDQYSHAIHLQNVSHSIIEILKIQYSYTGIYSGYYSPSNSSDTTSNHMESVTIRDVYVSEYKHYGIYLSSYTDFNINCKFNNFRVNNYDGASNRIATGGASFRNFKDSSVKNILIENTININCLSFNTCSSFILESFHIENCNNATDYNAYLYITESSISINGGIFINNAVTVSSLYSLFAFSATGSIDNIINIKNVVDSSNTISGGGAGKYAYAGAYSSKIKIYIDSLSLGAVFSSSALPAPTTNSDIPMLVKLNDTVYYEKINGRGVYYLSAMPTTGTFAIGDRVINTNSSVSQINTSYGKQFTYGWLRLTASSNHVLNTDWVPLSIKTVNQELPYVHAFANIGCACDGVTDDRGTLATYFSTHTDPCSLFIPSATLIGSDWTVPSNIKAIYFDSANGYFTVPTTKTLTFSGQKINADPKQAVFYGLGDYAGTIDNVDVYADWFDATTDIIRIQKAHDFCVANKNTLYFPVRTYALTDTFYWDNSKVNLRSSGATLLWEMDAAKYAVELTSNEGNFNYYQSHIVVENIMFEGTGTPKCKGFLYKGTSGVKATNGIRMIGCKIYGFEVGITMESQCYMVNWYNVDISGCVLAIKMATGFSNYGERVNFIGCAVFNCTNGIEMGNVDGTLHFTNSSLDYCTGTAINVTGGRVEFTTSHIELDARYVDMPFVLSGDGSCINLNGGLLVFTSYSSTACTYVLNNTSTGKGGFFANGVFLAGVNTTTKYFATGSGFTKFMNSKTANNDVGFKVVSNTEIANHMQEGSFENAFSFRDKIFISEDSVAVTARSVTGTNITLVSSTDYALTGSRSLKATKVGAAATTAVFTVMVPIDRNSIPKFEFYYKKPDTQTGSMLVQYGWINDNINMVLSHFDTVSDTTITFTADAVDWTRFLVANAAPRSPGHCDWLCIRFSLTGMNAGDLYFDDFVINSI